jgi:hypothetical protein
MCWFNPLNTHLLKCSRSNKDIKTQNTMCQCNAWCNVSCFYIHCLGTFMWYVAIYTNLLPHYKYKVYNLVDMIIIDFMWIDIVHQSIFYTRWRGFKGHIIWKTRFLTSSTHEINSSFRKNWLFTQQMLTNFHVFVSTNLRYIKRFKSYPLFKLDHFIQRRNINYYSKDARDLWCKLNNNQSPFNLWLPPKLCPPSLFLPMLCVEVSIVIYTTCKSHVKVNHLHLHIQFFYTYIYPITMYFFPPIYMRLVQIFIKYTYMPCVNVLGCTSVNI